MKKVKVLIAISIVSLFVFAQQPAKRYNVSMSMQEWQAVVDIIDNSATPGEVRKSLIGSIQYQVNAQIKNDTSKIKNIDSTTMKKKPR